MTDVQHKETAMNILCSIAASQLLDSNISKEKNLPGPSAPLKLARS
jgi:hypothetical protein